jgi:hypothetical protein
MSRCPLYVRWKTKTIQIDAPPLFEQFIKLLPDIIPNYANASYALLRYEEKHVTKTIDNEASY